MANILNIQVDPTQLDKLKNNHHVLCIAKTIDDGKGNADSATVIWAGIDFLVDNEFSWENNYSVFGAVEYKQGALVKARTVVQAIGFGQTCTVNKNGNLGQATGNVDQSGKFKVDNEWTGPEGMNVGVGCELRIRGVVPAETSNVGPPKGVFFVTPDRVLPNETVTLTPIDKVTVWFQVQGEAGSMISEIVGKKQVVDFTGGRAKTQTFSYNKDGHWQAGELPSA